MSRGKQFLTISGTYQSDVLGAFKIIRGFATLQDLAQISSARMMSRNAAGRLEGHQRELDVQHAEEVRRYLEDGDQRFIPEVILSVRKELQDIEMAGVTIGVRSVGDDPLLTIGRSAGSKNNSEHFISVEIKQLVRLKSEGRIRRIDGNHRLELASNLKPAPRSPKKYLVPFCAILLGEPGNEADDYSEALIFHSIHSTPKPLDSQHALELILGQEGGLSMRAENEFNFNPALHLTRLLHEKLGTWGIQARTRLGERPLASLNSASRELIRAYPVHCKDLTALAAYADVLNGVLSDLCSRLTRTDRDICSTPYFVELVGHIWEESVASDHHDRLAYAQKRIERMADWLGHDGLRGLHPDKPLGRQLLDIFTRIEQRTPKKLFIARWYPGDTDHVEQRNNSRYRLEAIKQTLVDLRASHSHHLAVVDMGEEPPKVGMIHEEMYEAIRSSEIILCDLTGVRPNVCVEAGYALEHHRRGRLIFLFQPGAGFEMPPFDLSPYRYIPISDSGAIKAPLTAAIVDILAKASNGEI